MKRVQRTACVLSSLIFCWALVSSAHADVWVSAVSSLDRYAPGGHRAVSLTSAFGLPVLGWLTAGGDALEVDPADGSVWVYDLHTPLPPPIPPNYYVGAMRLLHVSRDGVPLLQVSVLDGNGLALDPIRGGVWISRPEGRVDPHQTASDAPSELILLDPSTGAIKARIHGFRPRIYAITLGADGAIWVQHATPPNYGWTRLEGTLAQLNGYDISTGESGPHHRPVGFDFSSQAASAVNPSDGSVWLAYSTLQAGLYVGEVLKLSPEGLLLRRFTPRSFSYVAQISVNSRDGSVWLSDSIYDARFTGDVNAASGANVAHYSASGRELATAKHWDGLRAMAVDMTDSAPWALVAFELDDEREGPFSIVKLDRDGSPRPGIEHVYTNGVLYIAASTAPTAGAEIGIDIAPPDSRNRIDPDSTDRVAVALLSTPVLEATRVSTDTVRFGTAGAVAKASWTRDVNGDGLLDVVLQFRITDAGIHCGDTQAPLTGRTSTGLQLHGVDDVETINCTAP